VIDALSKGDKDAAGEVVDKGGFVDHSPGWGTTDFESVAESYAALRRALPDLRFDVDETNMVSEGNQVAAHSLARGTHTGEPLLGPQEQEVYARAGRLGLFEEASQQPAIFVARWTKT
jgi:predicted ester cyclase